MPSTDASEKSSEHRDGDVSPAPNAAPDDHQDLGALDDKPKSLVALVMCALSLAVFLSALDTTIVTTALPTIADHFQSAAGYTWVGSAYLVGNAASTLLWGKLSDIFGRKPVLLLANFIFFIGSLVAGLANSIGMLIAARAVQGIGGAGLLVLVDITISDLFSLRTRGAYLGVIGGVWAIACALGPIVGGALTEKVSWRWCFYINLPLDGLAFFIILFFLKLQTPRVPVVSGLLAIDWLGCLLVVGGTVMFLMGLQYGGVTFSWDSPTVLCLLIFGAFSIGLFIIVQWRFAKYPLIQLSTFNNRSNTGVLVFTFFHGIVYIAEFYYLPLYFQIVRGASPLLSGVYILPSVVSTGLAAVATGAFIGVTGKYMPPIYTGAFLMALGFGLFIDFGVHTGWAKLIIFQIIAGAGVGPNFQAPLVALQTGINPRDIATSTATFNFLRQTANAMSVVIGQVVFQNEMKKKQGKLIDALGVELGTLLGGGQAAANSELVDALSQPQRGIAQKAFANSLQPMWIMYTAFAVLALLTTSLIRSTVLTAEHETQEVGLEAEKRHAADRKAERTAQHGNREGVAPWT